MRQTLPRSFLAAGFLVAASVAVGCARKPPEPAKSAPPVVTVTVPISRLVTDFEDFTGRTEAIRYVELKARVTGYLEHVHFKDGQDVTEGKPLFSIDQRIYKAEKDRAAALLTKAEKHLATAEKNFKREDDLRKAGSGSKEAYDRAAGDLAEAEADIGSATAALELAQANLSFTRISAPFDGRLSRRLVDPGNLVKADETPLTTIVDLDTLYATFDVDERTVMRFRDLIRRGEITSSREQPRSVRIGLADDDAGEFPLSGLISFTDNAIDAGTGTLRVRAVVRNPRIERPPWYLLSPGQFIRVRLPVGNPRPALLVPEKSLGVDQGQKYLFIVNDRDEIERRNVRLGPQLGNFRVVEDKVLRPDDRVVVDGLLRVRPGTKVNPKPAEAMTPPDSHAAPVETAPAPRVRSE
jgi:multidrug efflux system membrane fusion protein